MPCFADLPLPGLLSSPLSTAMIGVSPSFRRPCCAPGKPSLSQPRGSEALTLTYLPTEDQINPSNLWPRLPAIHDLATVILLFLHFHLMVGRLGPSCEITQHGSEDSSLAVGLEMKMGLVSSRDVREYQRKTEGELRGWQNNGRTIQQGLLAVAGIKDQGYVKSPEMW